MSVLGPNTAASADLLRPSIILSGGEDGGELSHCLDQFLPPAQAYFEYRCYRFWTFADRAVIWTGIGTGCIEPLIWEVLSPGIVRKIILVGTAGRLPGAKVDLAAACCVTEAYSGGTSLDEILSKDPARPRFPLSGNESRATIVSTDYYYGFSPRALSGGYRAGGPGLQRAVQTHFHSRDLVDMETAQFYHFCESFDRTGTLQYLSIKAAANDVVNPSEQLEHSKRSLMNCLELAGRLSVSGGY